MATSSFLASFYFICGAIIFFFGIMILRYSTRDIVGWATALVLFFAGIGPLLGGMGVLLESNLQQNTYLFENLVASFDYIWEFFFPSLFLFALVYPKRHRIWKYFRRWAGILFFPHLFHLILLLVLIDRVNPERMFNFLNDLPGSSGTFSSFFATLAKYLNVWMGLLFKAHTGLFSLVNVAFAGFSLLFLRHSLSFELPPRVRRQMRVVVAGLGLCILTYSLGRALSFFRRDMFDQDMVIAFINASLIIGGGSIAFAIIRYQFLDIRLIARKGIFYGATVALFATIYLLTIKQITGVFYRFSGARVEFLETGLIVLFIIVFQPVLGRLEEWTEKVLVREETSPRIRMRDLSAELLSVIEIETMKEKIQLALSQMFGTDKVETVFAEEIMAVGNDDPYAEKVVELLSLVDEPMVRLDFMEAMDFLNLRGRNFFRPSRKVVLEAVETLPGIVRRFARYELIVPVVHEQKCVAALLLGARHEHNRYTVQEQAMLAMLARQIAASLSRIELLKEVVEKKVMEEELNLARTIQINLLPSAPPQLENYEAAALSVSSKQVGGDYYDFIKNDTHLAFTVADVSGKGVPASLLMASLQASLRAIMDRMDDPVAVISRLNDVMCDITATDKFATMFYGCINLRKNEVVYTNAGHFFPVVVRENGEVEELDYSGLILGVTPGFEYCKRKIKMGSGDIIVVTTDGVTEAENTQGELYGEERLHPFLSSIRHNSADKIKELIVEEVNRFSYPQGANDDLTIMVIKRLG
ncbi:MAG: PP2C family protein-serine/threonine phosphatase [Candidatus Krumholzibacteriota bacterium]|nr:PP2C family protein-serine/threonine phosphatase [Candidatus Krumholzibacteriota bacterium]